MFWSEVVEKYGEDTADRMSKSMYLTGNTCTIEFKDRRDADARYEDLLSGEADIDIPECDIELAYRDVILKEKINSMLWD